VASTVRKREKKDQEQMDRSIRRDVKQPAKRTVPPGQGDKGDQKRHK
jgi:hypothetical protein